MMAAPDFRRHLLGGEDPDTDLAILKISQRRTSPGPAKLGDAEHIKNWPACYSYWQSAGFSAYGFCRRGERPRPNTRRPNREDDG